MAYLGQGPFQEYSSIPTKDNFTGDGSTVAFDLASAVPSNGENGLEVFVSNTRQQPGSGKHFTLGQDGSGDFKRITFASAPSNGAEIYVINDKTNTTTLAPLSADMNGAELILDVDGDSSITADTDDRIDIKLSGVEHISFGNSSGDTVIKPMVDAKDILFQQYDGRTLLDINDGGYVAIANGATGPGQLRFYEDTDLGTNFTAFQVGTQSADITYTLPTADGTSGYLLSTDGNGVLSWAVAGSLSGAAFTNDGNNRVTTGTGSSTINGEANLTFDGSTLAVTGATTVSTTLGVTGILTGSNTVIGTTFEPTGDTSSSDNAAVGYTAAEGLILTGQGSTNDVTIKNDADGTVMSIPTGTTGVTFAGTVGSGAITSTGIVTGTGFTAGSAVLAEAELELLDGLTAGTAIASKVVTTDANIDSTGMRNLTISGTFSDGNYTFDTSGNVSGLGTVGSGAITSSGIVTGTGFTAGSAVLAEAELELLDGLTAGTAIASKVVTTDASIDTTGQRNLTISGELDAATLDISGAIDVAGNSVLASVDVTGVATAATFEPDGDTAAGDNAAIGYTAGEGLILTGQGSTSDVTLKNDADATVFTVPTGTDDILFPDSAKAMFGAASDLQIYHDGSNSYISDSGTGNLKLGGGNQVDIEGTGETMATFVDDGAVTLYHNNVAKVATTAAGATITGTVLATTDTDTSNTGSVTLDFTANQNFVLTLTGNVTLANPSTEQVGQSGFIACIQDGTGSRTLSLGTDYETAGAAGITLTTTAAATDLIPYLVVAANRILLGTPQLAFF